MTTITRRLSKLEDQFGTGNRKPRLLLVLCKAGWGLALDMDACVQILDDCGSLPHGSSRPISGSHASRSKFCRDSRFGQSERSIPAP
jgi:hypothetical protein